MWTRDWPIHPQRYQEEAVRYAQMAIRQQAESNLGLIPYEQGSIDDDLMRHVHLYDVAERKYAGFTQLLLDMWYGDTPDHPYATKMHSVRLPIAQRFGMAQTRAWGLPEWLYVFLIHRMTGSGIDYAKKPSGYHNTILPLLDPTLNLPGLVEQVWSILSTPVPAYTSVGYQFPVFPKKDQSVLGQFKRGGDRYFVEFAPVLAQDLADYLTSGRERTFREVGAWMADWNRLRGLRVYHFQHSAFIADIADFFPEYIDEWSHFFYGKNAVESWSYMLGKSNPSPKLMDPLTDRLVEATGMKPYNLEDCVGCDFIRWVEHYVRPGADYDHVDRDSVWGSSSIVEHPYGRQRPMIDLGLIDSFNRLKHHPSDDYVLRQARLDPHTYVEAVRALARS